ncbi:unnamed protein product [Clonostachys byssicola]|uniref:Allergen Asp f 4 n=1 Tax=Clonostachys byssicola TaxID=160290 RepID=A0A9N9XY47_9HYPO|nr:unnamed protein product [Clonostachys byssicola]
MKFSASTVLLAAALGVSAHPHGAVHNHIHRDTNLEVRDQFVKNVKPTSTVFQTVTVPAVNALNNVPTSSSSASVAVPATTTSSKAAATTTASSSSGTIGGSAPWTDDFCTGTSKRGTAEQNAFSGNTGTTYGCNLKFVEESAAKNYQYISVLENAASEKQVCACFLKSGPDGKAFTGFWKGNQVLDFELAPGAKKYLAVQAGTIGGCSCGVGSLPLTALGQISGVWLELEYGSELNGGFSGADASSLVPEDNGNPIQGLTLTTENPTLVSGHEKKSIIYPNGDGCNAFPKGTNAADGWGFNIANSQKGGDSIRLHAKWGTTGTLADCPNVTEADGKNWRQTRA